MAEGGIVGRLFGEEERNEGEAESLASGLDPTAAAFAAGAARAGDILPPEVIDYFKEQAHLVHLQTEHLHEQRAVQLDHLKLRRVGERMRVAIQAFFVAVGALIACGFVWMVWSAATDHGLVVEAFSVPPDLAARGLTGQVVAKQVLDRLSQLQAQTVTMRAPSTYQNNWGDDLKVEIPETGVSVADLSRYLRGLLGHETHITGDVYHTSAGLTVTARVGEDGVGVESFTGSESDYDKLIGQAAESVFGSTQPYRFASYLADHKRDAEAKAVYRRLTDSDDVEQRAWGYVGLGSMLTEAGDEQGAANQYRLAEAQRPHFAPALTNLSQVEYDLGHDAEAVKTARLLFTDPGAARREMANPNRVIYMTGAHLIYDIEYGDYLAALASERDLLSLNSDRAQRLYLQGVAFFSALDHDADRARTIYSDNPTLPDRDGILGVAAFDKGDASSVAFLKGLMASDAAKYGLVDATRSDMPRVVIAEARFGELAAARAQVATLPMDCYPCVRAKGTVSSYAGDRQAAEAWFAEAIRLAPGLPLAYLDRGKARFRAGDLDGALSDAKVAVRLGPHDPDGYGLWGDVLARQRRWREARGRYDEALKYAPAWSAARRARADVSARI